MDGSVRTYKDMVVTREWKIRVGSDGSERVRVVSVIRPSTNLSEVIMPNDPRFREAVEATKDNAENTKG